MESSHLVIFSTSGLSWTGARGRIAVTLKLRKTPLAENITKRKTKTTVQLYSQTNFKVFDSCRTCSTKCSDTFRSFFCMWKGARISKKNMSSPCKKNSPS